MSISNTIDLIEEHIENAYNALETGGADLTNINKNLTNINSQLIDRYEDYLANGTDIIWDNWENKSVQEGEILTFNNTIEAKIKTELKGNTSQTNTSTASGDEYNSPSPEHPQDIHIVTGDNIIKILGKNLFDINSRSQGSINSDGDLSFNANTNVFYNFNFKENTQYTVSGICKATGNTRLIFKYTDGTISDALQNNKTTYAYKNYTSKIGKTILQIKCTYGSSGSMQILKGELQIEEGISATTYEPYTSQTQLISLGNIELCKIGDCQDKIYKNNNKWWLEKNIEKIESYNGETINTDYISSTGGLDIGATVYYQLATPTTTEITDTTLIQQLNNLEKLKSYNNQTNILQKENADLPFIINATILLNE